MDPFSLLIVFVVLWGSWLVVELFLDHGGNEDE